jgi:serine/threonine protein kinase
MLGVMAASGEPLGGRYRLEGLLGTGGMATVHRAHDLLLGRQVAIKFLAPNIAAEPEHLERFGREARAMAGIVHPNLVAIQRIATEGPLAPPAVISLVEGLASALDALHRAGIVHRDVKPQNILLSPTGPKLADLGVIRLDDPADPQGGGLTASGATPGTLRFLAPEVIFGQAAGPKADAYALATVAFEALTGASPRTAVTLGDLVHGAWQPPMLVSDARPGLGHAFDAAFAAGLDLDPARRLDPQSFAAALWEALNAWLAHPPDAALIGLSSALDVTEIDPRGAAALAAGPGAAPTGARASSADPTSATLDGVARLNPTATPPGEATPYPARTFPELPTDPRHGTHRNRAADPLGRILPVLALLALTMGTIVLAILVGRPGVAPAGGNPTASMSASASLSTPSSATPAASPSPSASVAANAEALEAVDAVVAAIQAAQGGRDGLKGADANELLGLAADAREALEDLDFAAAHEAADRLADRVEKVAKDLDEARREALDGAIDRLRAAIPSS